jgi:putative membrane protein
MFGPSSSERVLSLVIRWLLLALAVWVAAKFVGGIHLQGWKSTLVVAAILGLLNLYVKPALQLLSLPFTILTLGIFLIVINAALLLLTSWIAGHISGIHFHVDDFLAAFLGAIVISLVSIVVHFFIDPNRIARKLTAGI